MITDMPKKICILLLLIAIFTTVGCNRIQNTNDDGKLHIITTIFPAYDFARSIVGENARVTMLLPPGAEVHSFEPTAQDMIDIQQCDLFIYNGGESDEWVHTLLSSDEYKNTNTLCMMDCVVPLAEEDHEHHGEEHHDHDNEHEEEMDEHVWTSPVNAIAISEAITKELCHIDEINENVYKSNMEIYRTHLKELDRQIREVAENAQTKTLVFADRFPMRYFAEEYGFDCHAAFPGCSTQTEPSVATIVELIDEVREGSLPAVFCMEFSDGRLADTICGETSAKKYYLHSCHNVAQSDFDSGVTYESLMKNNIDTLRMALGTK